MIPTDWQLRGVDDPGSVAGHTPSVAPLRPFSVDAERALRMAIRRGRYEAARDGR